MRRLAENTEETEVSCWPEFYYELRIEARPESLNPEVDTQDATSLLRLNDIAGPESLKIEWDTGILIYEPTNSEAYETKVELKIYIDMSDGVDYYDESSSTIEGITVKMTEITNCDLKPNQREIESQSQAIEGIFYFSSESPLKLTGEDVINMLDLGG